MRFHQREIEQPMRVVIGRPEHLPAGDQVQRLTIFRAVLLGRKFPEPKRVQILVYPSKPTIRIIKTVPCLI